MRIIRTAAYNAKTAAVEVDPATGNEVVVDDDAIDLEIDRMFGPDISKKRRQMGLNEKDKIHLRRRNPAGFNYLPRGLRQQLKEPLRDYTHETPMEPPKSASVKIADKHESWDYKGHRIVHDEDVLEDNIQSYYDVTTPDGRTLLAPLSPHERGRELVQLWIDAGYPDPRKFGRGNWDMQSLQQHIAGEQAKPNEGVSGF